MLYLKKNKLEILVSSLAIVLMLCLVACGKEQVLVDENSIEIAKTDASYFHLSSEDVRTDMSDHYEEFDLNQMEGDLHITDGGDFLLHGALEGRICIEAEDQLVHLFFQGVTIRSACDAALYVENASKVIITLMSDTDSYLLDGAGYINKDIDSCIYSNSDLTINGSGYMSVTGKYKDAIHSKDHVKIVGAQILTDAMNGGIKGNDGVFIKDATAIVQAKGDGIKTSKTGKNKKGSVQIADSYVVVVAGENAIACANDLVINGSNVMLNGVWSQMVVGGDTMIEEGNLTNE